ncbi:hypothetical protein DEJ51_11385 [Streptomyces venezuelae]|uniref:HTH cro/C1-type domain-containing protein n=1 Tax=Streptomyces venezuelae TaxID=54571 RepID=A0A5P2DI30_STRVZ|nr:helix-turn-helix transcriptional regulator [Streptomyces venezuelae]QES54752.1 hypothetical protein DEJ51_11385 [Streptomyces venezuelae]
MAEIPSPDVLLARLAEHRGLSIEDLSRLAAVPEAGLRAVLDGAAPDPSLLKRLAPVLQLHVEDLFVIASVPLPQEMTPLDPAAGGEAALLAKNAIGLPRQDRERLRRIAAALPQQDRTRPTPEPPAYMTYPPGPGGLVMRLLANRNLGWSAGAQTFLSLTGRYWSAATYGQVGHGEVELTPDLQADYATVLGIRADDLSVLTGIGLPDGHRPPPRAAVEVAGLVRGVRRLTRHQVRELADTAEHELRVP